MRSQANGFYGSKGISGLIPEGYRLLEQRFMRAVRASGRSWDPDRGGVQLSEWKREGWTYHAKGIKPRFFMLSRF
jgi:CDP-diacylglycerol--glycerol-3-phosphate 3-phosphatidyltransferase